MNRLKLFAGSLLCVVLYCSTEICAQFPGGDPQEFAARMVRRFDQDGDGSLDPEELERSGRLKDYLAEHNVDVTQPVPLNVVAEHQMEMFKAMREGGGFGGRPGGSDQGNPPAAPGGDRNQSDRSSGRDRGGRSGGGESDGRRGGRRGDAPPGGGSNPAPGSTKSKVRLARVAPKITLPPAMLPSQYAAKDTNRDGQLGMYEWSRTDLSSFRRLDTNADGFLTPGELAGPPSTSSMAASTTVPSSSGNRAPTATTTPAAAPSGPPADLKTVAAGGAFEALDTDKNGQLSDEEWQRSRYARKLFTEGKVEVQIPLTKAKFVESYVKLAP